MGKTLKTQIKYKEKDEILNKMTKRKNKKKYGKIKYINKAEKADKKAKRLNKIDLSKNNLKVITIVLILLVILILFLTGYSLSKSFSEIKISSVSEINNPVIVVNSNEKIKVTAEKNIGEYRFSVQNYNENEINEALLHYMIEIEANVDESINFELYKDDEKIPLNNNITDYIDIGKDKKEEHNYLLKIIYDKNKSKNIYDIIEKIQIKVHTEQKKI